jgi:hypothetical protein
LQLLRQHTLPPRTTATPKLQQQQRQQQLRSPRRAPASLAPAARLLLLPHRQLHLHSSAKRLASLLLLPTAHVTVRVQCSLPAAAPALRLPAVHLLRRQHLAY